MKRGILPILLFLVFVNILFVSATYSVGNKSYSLEKIYGPGATIQAWINISISNENIAELVRDNKGNTIGILDLLQSDTSLIEDTDYSCSPVGCGSSYSASNEEITKTFTLNKGETKLIGFKFEGTVSNIDEPEFKITSNAMEDCNNQLKINFFDNDIAEYGNDKNFFITCSEKKDYSCFNNSVTSNFNLNMPGNGKMFCQRTTLYESPGFKLGARLKILSGAYKTKMAIYDLDFNDELAKCELNNTPVVDAEVSCEVELLIMERDEYYVCIFNDNGVDTNTKIRSYVDTENGCGFYTTGQYAEEENAAYQMFAEGKKFGPVGTLNITGDNPVEELGSEMSDYIYEIYGGNACPIEGCIIPLQIISDKDQTITIKDIFVPYDSDFGPSTINEIYDLELSSAKVSTNGFKKISLSSSGFVLPNKTGNISYSVSFKGDKIFEEYITIEPVPEIKSVAPMIAFTQFPTNFQVSIKELANASIDSYTWQFGSATPKTTTENKISHTFTEVGKTTLKITIKDVKGKTNSRTFTIDVGDYQALFLQKLTEAKASIQNVSSQLSKFSQFYQDGIKTVFDATSLTQELTRIETAYEAADEDAEYTQVVNDFLALQIPLSVYEKISTAYVSFYSNKDAVNAQVVKEFLGGSLNGNEFAYADAVSDWSVKNIDAKIKYKRLDVRYADGTYPLINIFELNVKQVGDFDSSASIFIKQLDNMQFDKAYGENIKTGYIEIPIESEKTITFLTTEDLDITTVPIFVSPALGNLELITIQEEDLQGMRWALFIVILIFLILVGIVAYVFLQHWYKTKYETYLFKDRNFLFNLIHYIDTQKKKGVTDNEIFKRLKKQGWNSEQIDYVIRKYLGKRTGMFELPVEKILNLFKKPATSVPASPGMVPPINRPGIRPPIGKMPIRRPIGKPMPPRKSLIKK